jgi:hypothetical protein
MRCACNNIIIFCFKVNLAKKGWYPRPVLQISDQPSPERTAHWDEHFRHTVFGSPLNILAIPLDGPDRTEGSRQSWKYSVTYPNEKAAEFVLPCPSLPVDIDVNCVIQRLSDPPRQSFRGTYFRNMQELKSATFRLLRLRNYMERYNEEWVK